MGVCEVATIPLAPSFFRSKVSSKKCPNFDFRVSFFCHNNDHVLEYSRHKLDLVDGFAFKL